MTPAPPTKTRAASAAPESKEGVEDGEPLVTVPLTPVGEVTVPFPDTGATGAGVMVLATLVVLADRVDEAEITVSALLLAEAVLLT